MRPSHGRALLVACGLLAGGCASRGGPTLSGPLASVSFRNTQPEGIPTAEILLHRRSARGSRVIYRGTGELVGPLSNCAGVEDGLWSPDGLYLPYCGTAVDESGTGFLHRVGFLTVGPREADCGEVDVGRYSFLDWLPGAAHVAVIDRGLDGAWSLVDAACDREGRLSRVRMERADGTFQDLEVGEGDLLPLASADQQCDDDGGNCLLYTNGTCVSIDGPGKDRAVTIVFWDVQRGDEVRIRRIGELRAALGEAVQVPQTWTALVRTLEILEPAGHVARRPFFARAVPDGG